MKNPIYTFALMILAAGALIAALIRHEENPMKLVNAKTGYVVVEFLHDKPLFNDRFLEEEMLETGIAIPADLRAEFEGQETIYLGDPLFQRAFLEVYVPLAIASSVYEWQKKEQ